MTPLEMSHLDLECGRRGPAGTASRNEALDEEEGGSMCFSDADEGSCNSQFYSTADGDGSYDDFSLACGSDSGEISDDEALELKRASECSVNIEDGGLDETKLHMAGIERDCRICHLSLVSSSPAGSGVAIELGCSCKDDLAAAHKHCAETWFKIKGNKTCEICNSIASNVVGPNDIEAAQAASDSTAGSIAATMASAPPSSSTIETPSCSNGHRFLNFLLACMVFAFVISWLFHFNIPS